MSSTLGAYPALPCVVRFRRSTWFLLACCLVLGWNSPRAWAEEEIAEEPIRPADVLARVELLERHVEHLRWYMGQPQVTTAVIQVEAAQPREVYFQARTLFDKANRLSGELAGSEAPVPELVAARDVQPANVRVLVTAALERLRAVYAARNITADFSERHRAPETTPTDVYRAILQVSRQLNALLENPFTSTDTYLKVSEAITLAEGLVARFPDLSGEIAPEPQNPGLGTVDVFNRLQHCLRLIRHVMERSGETMLSVRNVTGGVITPGDAHDLAELAVSELAYLHSLLSTEPVRPDVQRTQRRIPMETAGQVARLEQHLVTLLAAIERHPGWLKRK